MPRTAQQAEKKSKPRVQGNDKDTAPTNRNRHVNQILPHSIGTTEHLRDSMTHTTPNGNEEYNAAGHGYDSLDDMRNKDLVYSDQHGIQVRGGNGNEGEDQELQIDMNREHLHLPQLVH